MFIMSNLEIYKIVNFKGEYYDTPPSAQCSLFIWEVVLWLVILVEKDVQEILRLLCIRKVVRKIGEIYSPITFIQRIKI